MSEGVPVEVLFTSEFKRALRRLAKRYRRIRTDVEPLINRLACGETPGDRIRGTNRVMYKVRLPNSDARRGKRGGYRVVYYVQTASRVILITIYSKSDQGDIAPGELRKIVEEDLE